MKIVNIKNDEVVETKITIGCRKFNLISEICLCNKKNGKKVDNTVIVLIGSTNFAVY